ncbi:hypothetical protein IE53DRAFT_363429 [Violaceomyces palustris]|uniref:Uncharacterized protein n=1 Tax=Violaceomyces palustris TaxID=1673888 RepID=A0ACD0NTB8_9BASI|nr:hypothetical protein IE53DRAFT_363429 [Violaceomyces palustris]
MGLKSNRSTTPLLSGQTENHEGGDLDRKQHKASRRLVIPEEIQDYGLPDDDDEDLEPSGGTSSFFSLNLFEPETSPTKHGKGKKRARNEDHLREDDPGAWSTRQASSWWDGARLRRGTDSLTGEQRGSILRRSFRTVESVYSLSHPQEVVQASSSSSSPMTSAKHLISTFSTSPYQCQGNNPDRILDLLLSEYEDSLLARCPPPELGFEVEISLGSASDHLEGEEEEGVWGSPVERTTSNSASGGGGGSVEVVRIVVPIKMEGKWCEGKRLLTRPLALCDDVPCSRGSRGPNPILEHLEQRRRRAGGDQRLEEGSNGSGGVSRSRLDRDLPRQQVLDPVTQTVTKASRSSVRIWRERRREGLVPPWFPLYHNVTAATHEPEDESTLPVHDSRRSTEERGHSDDDRRNLDQTKGEDGDDDDNPDSDLDLNLIFSKNQDLSSFSSPAFRGVQRSLRRFANDRSFDKTLVIRRHFFPGRWSEPSRWTEFEPRLSEMVRESIRSDRKGRSFGGRKWEGFKVLGVRNLDREEEDRILTIQIVWKPLLPIYWIVSRTSPALIKMVERLEIVPRPTLLMINLTFLSLTLILLLLLLPPLDGFLLLASFFFPPAIFNLGLSILGSAGLKRLGRFLWGSRIYDEVGLVASWSS